jgi:hypothetical protein
VQSNQGKERMRLRVKRLRKEQRVGCGRKGGGWSDKAKLESEDVFEIRNSDI